MSSLPHCILSAPLTDAAADSLKQAITDSGAKGVLLTGAIAVIGDEGDAARHKIAALGKIPGLMIEVDLARFPIDHPLVVAHPELFAVRRLPGERATIDPRQAMPATGEALARLRSEEASALLADLLVERLEAFVSAGVSGFKLNAPDRMGAGLMSRLVQRFSDRDIRFIAGPMAERAAAARLAEAGLDGVITSYGWWDLSAAWMVEEVAALRGNAPLIAEFSGDYADPVAGLEIVPLAADAMIVPATWLAVEDRRAAIRRACAGFANGEALNGELRQASAPNDMMTVLVRGDCADLRQAGAVAVGIVNRGEARALPGSATLLQSTGAQMGAFETEASDVPEQLAPGQAVLLRAQRSGAVTPAPRGDAANARDWPRLVVEGLSPRVEGGDFAVKRVVGDTVAVEALVFADGHEQLAAELQWRAADEVEWRAVAMIAIDADTWVAEFVPERLGAHEFRVEGWLDRFGGFTRDFRKKLLAGVAQPVDRQEGLALIEAAAERSDGALGGALADLAERIDAADEDEKSALLLDDQTAELMARADDRPHSLHSHSQRLDAERLAARFSSWYELFPRSMTDDKARHGTFIDVIDRLPAIRDMGFDTLYFPPIHPIGTTNRKGPNNTLTPEAGDPGSPYAIGSEEGGHDAIHPELGSFADFDRLVAAAREHGLEIALDFAIQCSPDHPWLKEHPGWFAWRPDGSMKYAENPPKKYQDIVNVDFYGPDAVPGLWKALRDVVLLWVDHGVKTFRVDNPHTKPLPFWEWMIGEVRAAHPDVIFLSEAFTRPTMMYRLAKVGFSQSYTYFTWRDSKYDLTEYVTELTTSAAKDFYRPHFFVNTPDINPLFLQTSGRAGFRIRAVLAATLSGLFGVYSGFELCESAPLAPGKEEYLDSEKYEVRPRDYEAPGNIIADITLLNRLRRTYPALQTHLNTRFFAAYDDNILWYAKPAADGTSMIMVMVNLDPHGAHECDFEVPLWEFGLSDTGAVAVEDLAAGHRFTWHGKVQHIRIAPDEPYRIWRITPEGRA